MTKMNVNFYIIVYNGLDASLPHSHTPSLPQSLPHSLPPSLLTPFLPVFPSLPASACTHLARARAHTCRPARERPPIDRPDT